MMVAGSIAGTVVGGGATVGTAQLAYTVGISAWWFTLGSGIAFILMGLFYARPLRAAGLTTIPEVLTAHYGKSAGTIASLVASAGILLSAVASSLPGIGILSAVLRIEPWPAAGVLLGGVFSDFKGRRPVVLAPPGNGSSVTVEPTRRNPSAEAAGPGFVNVRLSAAAAGELARTIVQAGPDYGRSAVQAGSVVNLEYVSANPTGPLHIGHARWAAVGDALARILDFTGAEVVREYYFNDHGNQIDHFADSLLASAVGREIPADGYGGQYIEDISRAVIDQCVQAGEPDPRALPQAQAREVFRSRGVELMFEEIKASLHEFRSDFDVFFHEQSLHESGAVARAIERLRERGVIFDREGAVWLRSTDFGDDKDRVIIKSDGQAAYFAADLAYYLDKRARGADRCVHMLGADHHGYIGRMYAMARAFGDTAGPGRNMDILIGQLVNLVRGGEPVRMSKRAGNVVTMEDLVEMVGVDAARYSLVRASVDTTLELDLDVVASRTADNPVFYVQYAHARTCSVAANAAEHGVRRPGGKTRQHSQCFSPFHRSLPLFSLAGILIWKDLAGLQPRFERKRAMDARHKRGKPRSSPRFYHILRILQELFSLRLLFLSANGRFPKNPARFIPLRG